jgi:hypothetical protein
MIAAGIVAALSINTIMWPQHCRVCVSKITQSARSYVLDQTLFLSSTSQTLALLSELYLSLGRYVLALAFLSTLYLVTFTVIFSCEANLVLSTIGKSFSSLSYTSATPSPVFLTS